MKSDKPKQIIRIKDTENLEIKTINVLKQRSVTCTELSQLLNCNQKALTWTKRTLEKEGIIIVPKQKVKCKVTGRKVQLLTFNKNLICH